MLLPSLPNPSRREAWRQSLGIASMEPPYYSGGLYFSENWPFFHFCRVATLRVFAWVGHHSLFLRDRWREVPDGCTNPCEIACFMMPQLDSTLCNEDVFSFEMIAEAIYDVRLCDTGVWVIFFSKWNCVQPLNAILFFKCKYQREY